MIRVGVDEAGTGSAIADIYACAMELDETLKTHPQVTDSKKLTPKQRDKVFDVITSSNSLFGIGIVSCAELDSIGMAKARRLVFDRAIQELRKRCPEIHHVIFDGTFGVDVEGVPKECIECIPKADFKFPEVSAASIVAKVSRDKSILKLCEEHSDLATTYGWSSNKGYLSSHHTNAIREHGLSDFHRKSFDYKCLK